MVNKRSGINYRERTKRVVQDLQNKTNIYAGVCWSFCVACKSLTSSL